MKNIEIKQLIKSVDQMASMLIVMKSVLERLLAERKNNAD